MPDDPLLMQIMDILNEFSVHCPVPLFDRINVMDHSKVHVIRPEPSELILKSGLYKLHIPGPYILSVLPGRADMALYVPGIPAFLRCLTDDIPGLRIRHPAVHDIDPSLMGISEKLHRVLFVMSLKPFPAKADLAYLNPCFSEFSVSHILSSCANKSVGSAVILLLLRHLHRRRSVLLSDPLFQNFSG